MIGPIDHSKTKKPASRTPLYLAAADSLAEQIADQPVGTRLPSEDELAGQLGSADSPRGQHWLSWRGATLFVGDREAEHTSPDESITRSVDIIRRRGVRVFVAPGSPPRCAPRAGASNTRHPRSAAG